jgi:rhodanese-related sulfurtransferase
MSRRYGEDAAMIPNISAREAYARLTDAAAKPMPVLVDVREIEEYAGGHAVGAVNIPLSEFRERFTEVPRDRDVLLICHTGQRSMMAANFLQHQGVTRVANVDGGTDEWEAAKLPMERGKR